ncbi:unnamed protein product [Brassica rapa subsp. trilocularis]
MRGPNGVHWSYQKLAERPVPTLHLRNRTARKPTRTHSLGTGTR